MIDLVKIDPFLYGYFENETLEHGERVGLALLCASKNLPVKFSRQLLPVRVTLRRKDFGFQMKTF